MRQPAATIQKVCKHHGLTTHYVRGRGYCMICAKASAKEWQAKRRAAKLKRIAGRVQRRFKVTVRIPGVCVQCKGPKSLESLGVHCPACARQETSRKLRQASEDLKGQVTWERISAAFERRKHAHNHS